MKKKKQNKVISADYDQEIKGRKGIVYGAAGAGQCAVCPYGMDGVCYFVGGCTFRRF